MDTKRMILLRYSLTGAILGYCIFHPLIMLLSYMMTAGDAGLEMTNTVGVIAIVLRSFSIDMLPWSLSFTLFNGIIGMYYGILKAEKLAREELIIDLQKALAEVKTLSGMLPICAWCKKIRDDSKFWSSVEDYISKHSEAQFSHSICPDCIEEQYLELNAKISEKTVS